MSFLHLLLLTTFTYTWGESSETKRIFLDGMPFTVRSNLYAVLVIFVIMYLNQTLPEPHLFWIDAICIDQANLQERSHQVNMMGDIYSLPERVIVWLGDSNDDQGQNAVSLFKSVTDVADKHEFLPSPAVNMPAFWNIGYWSRAWIVQDFCQAKRILLVCGAATCDLSMLEKYLPRLKGTSKSSSLLSLRRTLVASRRNPNQPQFSFLSFLKTLGKSLQRQV